MKKISTLIFVITVCSSVFVSCSKDVKKPTSQVVVSNATTKTGSTTQTTTTQTTTTQNQGGSTCGHSTCGGSNGSNTGCGSH